MANYGAAFEAHDHDPMSASTGSLRGRRWDHLHFKRIAQSLTAAGVGMARTMSATTGGRRGYPASSTSPTPVRTSSSSD
mgnify:CR=1 FL=1